MDFGALPPEINSGKMYAGAGSGPMVAAATAWEQLAAELRAAANQYHSILAGLAGGPWTGPASTAMASSAAPYVTWMNTTATQAEQAATQAQAAAAAYETAFASMAPPPLIAANRSELSALTATNLLGQNTPAIAANEAEYGGMWTQDAAAMYGYAGQSASASQITPFTAPPQNSNPAGVANQAASTAGAGSHGPLSQLVNGIPSALQSFQTGGGGNPLQSLVSALGDVFSNQTSASSLASDLELVPKLILPANDAMIVTILGTALGTRAAGAAASVSAASAGSALGAGLGTTSSVAGAASVGSAASVAGAASSTGSAVTAGMGRAGAVSGLAVPPSWAEATPQIRMAANVLQSAGLEAAPVVAADGSSSLLGQMGAASLAGSAVGNTASRAAGGTVERLTRPPKDKEKQTPDKLKRVLAEMSQEPEAVQHWHTDEAQLEGLLAQLSKKPGVHAVHLSGKKVTPPKSQLG